MSIANGAFNLQLSAKLLQATIDNGEAKASAARFCGEKWLAYFFPLGSRNAGAVIFNTYRAGRFIALQS
jgi:hypothetical protein